MLMEIGKVYLKTKHTHLFLKGENNKAQNRIFLIFKLYCN